MSAANKDFPNDSNGPDSLDPEERLNETKGDHQEPKSSAGVIQILPSEVVQQIAAGEVVQRASSAIKELLENSIDAAADTIRVSISLASACPSFSVVDNGTGIAPNDLRLACTRHATSKIRSYKDLRSISSFGFRGEALAALSMVSRVTITSKTASTNDQSSACAYQMMYSNGRPNSEEPTRTARTVGTTIQVNDLFYNLPHRQASKKSSASTEYQSILKVLQAYAIHHAAQGIAISCQKQGTSMADVNTAPFVAAVQKALPKTRTDVTISEDNTSSDSDSEATVRALQEAATKHVIGHTFGSHLIPFLLPHSSSLYGRERRDVSASASVQVLDPLSAFETDDEKKEEKEVFSDLLEVASTVISSRTSSEKPQSLIYSCTGYVTSPSFFQSSDLKKKVGLQRPNPIVLFINHRFIEGCSVLRRSVEEVYVKCCKQKPPFLYLSIHVPPDTIDVNVHPTKREVVLLHMEEIRAHLAQQIKEQLEAVGYTVPNIAPSDPPAPQTGTINPYHVDKKRKLSQSQIMQDPPAASTALKPSSSSKAPPVILPKNKIRTSRALQSGSLEPFLVPRSSQSQNTQPQQCVADSQNDVHGSSQDDAATSSPSSTPEEPGNGPVVDAKCPLHDVDNSTTDLAIPGAFATLAARCSCPKKVALDLSQSSDAQLDGFPIRLPSQTNTLASNVAAAGRALRLQRLSPTSCSYTSIQQLRKRTFTKLRDEEWEKKLRSACFVGTVSHHRTLMQCGEELVLMNHLACAEELFYQLALNRFGGGIGVAKISDKSENGTTSGVDIEAVIGHFVQLEELLHQPSLNLDDVLSWSLPIKVSETNQALASQAAACLLQHADMLLEYYSVQIEKDGTTGKACLTGLPILIEGFEPSPHGLPLFLLRLASEVDWTEEKPCFRGICRELGSFYAQLPANGSREDHAARVQHTLFPAITALLVPTKDMKQKNDFVMLTSLPKLYRVFERC